MAHDSDGEKPIDYQEFKNFRHDDFKVGPRTPNSAADLRSMEVQSPVQLQPCPKCKLGLWEPVVDKNSGYVVLDLRNTASHGLVTFPGEITVEVPACISIYGIAQIVKRELGPCTVNVRIFQPTANGTKVEMVSDKKLRDFGVVGRLRPDEADKVTLLFDYDYPLLDCPLLMANFSV